MYVGKQFQTRSTESSPDSNKTIQMQNAKALLHVDNKIEARFAMNMSFCNEEND